MLPCLIYVAVDITMLMAIMLLFMLCFDAIFAAADAAFFRFDYFLRHYYAFSPLLPLRFFIFYAFFILRYTRRIMSPYTYADATLSALILMLLLSSRVSTLSPATSRHHGILRCHACCCRYKRDYCYAAIIIFAMLRAATISTAHYCRFVIHVTNVVTLIITPAADADAYYAAMKRHGHCFRRRYDSRERLQFSLRLRLMPPLLLMLTPLFRYAMLPLRYALLMAMVMAMLIRDTPLRQMLYDTLAPFLLLHACHTFIFRVERYTVVRPRMVVIYAAYATVVYAFMLMPPHYAIHML